MTYSRLPWTAVIPLRAGSKGLPGKNTRGLAGKPLYRHAVDLALAAGASRVILSTDIPELLTAAVPPGVQTLERPADLCGDAVPMAPVLIQALQATNVRARWCCCRPPRHCVRWMMFQLLWLCLRQGSSNW